MSCFFRKHPTETEREYLLGVFEETGRLPGMKDFFDRKHNPLWLAAPSGDACRELWQFWHKTIPETGALVHNFTDPEWNTRFLGDLYQDLSESARKRFALLQTPVFVEEFILDRTLTPPSRVRLPRRPPDRSRPAAPGTSFSGLSTACSTSAPSPTKTSGISRNAPSIRFSAWT